jgi:RNA polymerase primary sigma factor
MAGVPPQAPPAVPPAPTPFKAATMRAEMEGAEAGGSAPGEGEFDDDDDMENLPSLAASEAGLKARVVETFDKVADAYKQLRRLQDQEIEFKLKSTILSPAQQRRYKKLKDDIISEVKSLRLNQIRIELRLAVPRPDPARQYRADESGRQI